METTIIPILVALGIVGLNFYIQYGENGLIEKTLTTYFLVFPLVLSIVHLKSLISGGVQNRLFIFFLDAVFLVTVINATIMVLINYGLLNLYQMSFKLYLVTFIEIILTVVILWYVFFKKIIPAFDTDIFPTLCKKYKLFKYKKSEEKPKRSKGKAKDKKSK